MNQNSMSAALAVLGILLAGTAFEREGQAYYGIHSTQAVLTFEAVADVPVEGNPTLSDLALDGPARTAALAKIDGQIRHLTGDFHSDTFKNRTGYPAVLGPSYEIVFKGIAPGSNPRRKRISYSFKGTTVFDREFFGKGPSRAVPLWLPLQPDKIYDLGVKWGRNQCTDKEFNDRGDFYYYWDPKLPTCPLADDTTDVIYFDGQVEELPNTTDTYPEYDRLYDKGSLDVWVFFGYISGPTSVHTWNPRDDGDYAFRAMNEHLLGAGFKQTAELSRFRMGPDGRMMAGEKWNNFLREFEKTGSYQGRDLKVTVHVLLSDTDFKSRDLTFHHYLLPALRDADIVDYDGHSGDSANLDLQALGFAGFVPGKYQLFFINGCDSYPNYLGQFLDARGTGWKDMNLVLAGTPTLSDSMAPNAWAFIHPFIEGETQSYQRILGEIEASNGQGDGTFLTGVVGDEASYWKP